jgi:hypothetical protein
MSPSVQVRIANHDGGPTVLSQFILAGILDQVRLRVCRFCGLGLDVTGVLDQSQCQHLFNVLGLWLILAGTLDQSQCYHLFNIRAGLRLILAGTLDHLRNWPDLDDT